MLVALMNRTRQLPGLWASACVALSGKTMGTLRWYSCACDHLLAGLVRWLVVASLEGWISNLKIDPGGGEVQLRSSTLLESFPFITTPRPPCARPSRMPPSAIATDPAAASASPQCGGGKAPFQRALRGKRRSIASWWSGTRHQCTAEGGLSGKLLRWWWWWVDWRGSPDTPSPW